MSDVAAEWSMCPRRASSRSTTMVEIQNAMSTAMPKPVICSGPMRRRRAGRCGRTEGACGMCEVEQAI
jgi:hypothetical protein